MNPLIKLTLCVTITIGLLEGCATRSDFTAISGKNVNLSNINNSMAKGRTTGEDCQHIIIIIPTSGYGDLARVAWSQNGQSLYAGGTYGDATGKNSLLSWSNAGRGAYKRQAMSSNTIMDIQSLRDQRLVYAAADPVWGVLTNDGRKALEKTALIVDHRDSELRLNSKATVFAFSRNFKDKRPPLIFDLNQQAYITTPAGAALSSAKTAAMSDGIIYWYKTLKPMLNQQQLKLNVYEILPKSCNPMTKNIE